MIDLISTIIVIVPLPFFIMIAAIPSVILLDITKKQRFNYMSKLAKIFYTIEQNMDASEGRNRKTIILTVFDTHHPILKLTICD